MGAVITAEALTKRFRRPVKQAGLSGSLKHLVRPRYTEVTAVDEVDLSIEAGESVAYVGPNGAGKSTTIKLLCGIIVPSAGRVRVCDVEPHRHRSRNARNISVVFGQRTQLWWDIPVIESLRLIGDIYSVPAADYERNLAEMVDVLDLAPLLDVPVRQLSLGQRMRCDLAAALVHSPTVLFLDEPTIGLDVAVKAKLREFVGLMVRERGLTLMLTSHDLGDIEQLCPRLVMLHSGRVLYDGPYAELTRRFAWETKITSTLAAPPGGRPEEAAADILGVTRAELHDLTTLNVWFDMRVTTYGAVISGIVDRFAISDISVEEGDAEDVIRRLYSGDLKFSTEDVS
ncbi:ABC-2 type transport system ATP-binding protein [Lentzea xinjiangensis]|uniref:ABC-2 type transport system ATP-binding protein n=1 Tax=Lentzea xinjiangensis TaxID=402600 RepID=A0A1H9WQN8_9PSEU|nr:ATP-binding cassette domain-containing protein [Lentzea xinjiangensis]SES36109.1 ABC-2 type transport system ATP-binding protein [Lentzea xinjiangensis]